jgi:hypothetical protein
VDAQRFDTWVRSLLAGCTRRSLAGTALAALLGSAGIGDASAAPRCPNNTGCNTRCRNTQKICWCIKTTNGKRVCVRACCGVQTCTNNGDCAANEVCMKHDCCSQGGPTCIRKCTEPLPDLCFVTSSLTARTEGGAAAWDPTGA